MDIAKSAAQTKGRDKKMSENKRANNDNETTMTSFDRLIGSIKTNYLNNGDYMTPLYDLSIACAYSVCNKLQFVGYTDKIRQIKQSIAASLSMLSGNVSDDKKISDRVGDGMDLVHSAFAVGLDEVEKHNGDLEAPYLISRVSRRVWYDDPGICRPTESETCGIREMYRAARRYIQDNRAVQADATNKHRYVEYMFSEFTDSDDELSEFSEDYVIYRRMPTVYDGDDIALTDAITSDHGDADITDNLIGSLNLSDKEQKILNYRLRGYGERAIAKACGISRDSVHGAMNRIRAKARKSGLFKQYDI